MTPQLLASSICGVAGTACAALAVRNERRMQRHRQPGVSYAAATFRRDGGWRRADLFTPQGLEYQARASRFGLAGAVLWGLGLSVWVVGGVLCIQC